MERDDIIKSKKQQIEDSIKELHILVLPNYKAESSKFEDSEFNKNKKNHLDLFIIMKRYVKRIVLQNFSII